MLDDKTPKDNKNNKKKSEVDNVNLNTEIVEESIPSYITTESDLLVVRVPGTMGGQSHHGYDCNYTDTFGINRTFHTEIPVHEQYAFDFQNLFDINQLKANGTSAADAYNDMVSFIASNIKDSPEDVQIAIATLMGTSYSYYDSGTNNIIHTSGFTRRDLGDSALDILNQLYNVPTGDMLEGFVCSTISEFIMKLLNESGIEATMFCGGDTGSNHTTLLYKQADGQYIYVNQTQSAVLNAPNIKAAAKLAHGSRISQGDFGYIMFVDSNGSYQEFSLRDEAAWGEELDKRDYNEKIAELPIIENKPELSATMDKSAFGGVKANVTYTKPKILKFRMKQNKFSLEYKNKNFGSDDLYRYTSVGFKTEKSNIKRRAKNSQKFSDNKFIFSITNTTNPSIEKECEIIDTGRYIDEEFVQDTIMNNPDLPAYVVNNLLNTCANYEFSPYDYATSTLDKITSTNFTLFNRNERGVKTKLNDNFNTTGMISSTVGLNLRPIDGYIFCGDLRLSAEQSLSYNNSAKNTTVNAYANAGVVADMSIRTGVLKGGVVIGGKGNAGLALTQSLGEDTKAGVYTSANIVVTPVSTDSNFRVGAGFDKKISNKSSIFGNISAGKGKQQLRIGGFNEETENVKTWSAQIGMQNKNTTFQAGYQKNFDKYNNARCRNIFSAGINISF